MRLLWLSVLIAVILALPFLFFGETFEAWFTGEGAIVPREDEFAILPAHGFELMLRIASAISSGVTSRKCVATDQSWPNGSVILQ